MPLSATSGALQPVEAKKKAAPNALSEDVGLSKGKRIVGWIGLAKKNEKNLIFAAVYDVFDIVL